jgi:hypothetical protein
MAVDGACRALSHGNELLRQARDIPALEKPRAATRAAPKERAMATMVAVFSVGVEMSWRWIGPSMDGEEGGGWRR